MIFSTIHFSELSKFNDSNSLVATGLILEESDLENVNLFLECEIGLTKNKKLIGAYRILDNVLGNEGRTDWLLVFDNENVNFNYIARLQVGSWIKWTSDFIDNFAEDYASAA